MRKFVGSFALAMALGSCATTSWTQEGKSDRESKKDKGECDAQAHAECPHDQYGNCTKQAFGNCMEGRGWERHVKNNDPFSGSLLGNSDDEAAH